MTKKNYGEDFIEYNRDVYSEEELFDFRTDAEINADAEWNSLYEAYNIQKDMELDNMHEREGANKAEDEFVKMVLSSVIPGPKNISQKKDSDWKYIRKHNDLDSDLEKEINLNLTNEIIGFTLESFNTQRNILSFIFSNCKIKKKVDIFKSNSGRLKLWVSKI